MQKSGGKRKKQVNLFSQEGADITSMKLPGIYNIVYSIDYLTLMQILTRSVSCQLLSFVCVSSVCLLFMTMCLLICSIPLFCRVDQPLDQPHLHTGFSPAPCQSTFFSYPRKASFGIPCPVIGFPVVVVVGVNPPATAAAAV